MNLLTATVKSIPTLDTAAMDLAQARLDNLTKPLGSLGRLESLAKTVAGITANPRPTLAKKAVITIAGDHGVARSGVSAFPQEVTPQMVYNFLAGGAAINVLARHAGANVTVVDAGVASDLEQKPGLVCAKVAYGTNDMTTGAAMTREQAVQAIEAGISAAKAEIAKGANIIATGDMGIGNTTPSSAIVSVITGKPVAQVTGRGTGINDASLTLKINAITTAIAVNKPDPKDGIDVVAKVGGFEIAALAGVYLACAANRVPVVIDGFISGAAALIAYAIAPQCRDFMIPSHCSVEQGHKATLDHLKLEPLFDFGMRLGEGTGAAIAITIVDASLKILNEMATFADAGVSEKSK